MYIYILLLHHCVLIDKCYLIESLKVDGQKTYKRHYYLSTLPRPSIPFTVKRWNKSYKHTVYLKKP